VDKDSEAITYYVLPSEGLDICGLLESIEVDLIKQALEKASSISKAARLLGLKRTTLIYKCHRHGLYPPIYIRSRKI